LIAHLLYPVFIELSVFIEWVRWRQSFGRVVNLNKKVTLSIAAVLIVAAFFINHFLFWGLKWDLSLLVEIPAYILECAGFRGLLYDPSLNLAMGRNIEKESETTNSRTDQKEQERRIRFWQQRIIYGAIGVLALILFEITKRYS
jgi:hypothetical protein